MGSLCFYLADLQILLQPSTQRNHTDLADLCWTVCIRYHRKQRLELFTVEYTAKWLTQLWIHKKHSILPIHVPQWSCSGGMVYLMLLTPPSIQSVFLFCACSSKTILCNGVSNVAYGELELFFKWSPVVCSAECVTGSLTIFGSMTTGWWHLNAPWSRSSSHQVNKGEHDFNCAGGLH